MPRPYTNGNCIPVTYKGRTYPSYAALYRHYCQKSGKQPSELISYGPFVNNWVRVYGVGKAVRHLLEGKLPPGEQENTLQKKSRELGAADNLVCQRMTKLGWSYEKAVNTPKKTKHLPKRVRYRGKVYKSINACYTAVKPECSVVKFTKILRSKGLIK